jgi:hypothetical protein
VALADASTTPDAAAALAQLREALPQLRGAAILAGDGEVLAASGDPVAWGGASRELLEAADADGGEKAAHAHIATADGEVFCVREGALVAVAVTDRFVLASLMLFDLRAALRGLRG